MDTATDETREIEFRRMIAAALERCPHSEEPRPRMDCPACAIIACDAERLR